MSANSDWIAWMRDTIGVDHLFQWDESSGSFNDAITSLTVPVTSGITRSQGSGLIGNTTDKSIRGTSAVVTTKSGALTLGGTDLKGPYGVGCLFKYYATPTVTEALFSMGLDGGGSRHKWAVIHHTTLTPDALRILVPGINFQNIEMDMPASGLRDGNFHLLMLNYDYAVSSFWQKSIDGSVFSACGGAAMDMNSTSIDSGGGVGIEPLNDAGTYDGASTGIDEFFSRSTVFEDQDAADIYDKMLVTGFPQGNAVMAGSNF